MATFGPGLAGWFGAEQARNANTGAQIQQLGGLIGIQNAMAEQQMTPLKIQKMRSDLEASVAQRAALTKYADTLPDPEKLKFMADPQGYIKAQTGYHAIGSGGAIGPNGQAIPPMARPTTPQPSNVARLITERDALPQNDPNRKLWDDAITHATNPQAQRIIIPPQPRQIQLTEDASGNKLIVNPDGTTKALTAPTGEPLRGKIPTNPAAQQMYRDYANHPQVKEANDLEAKIHPLVDYMIDFKKTGKSVNANDAALAKAYLATTTWLGSRAYAVDQKQLASLPDLGDRLGNMASSFFAGKDLTDQTRTEMFNYITQRYKALDTARNQQKASVAARAKARGVPVEQVFGAENQ